MIFEPIDTKKICDSCYADGKIVSFKDLESPTASWDYSHFTKDLNVELASIYAGTDHIVEACPVEYKESLNEYVKKLRAILKATRTAKVSLDENCFFDMAPGYFVREYFDLRSKIIQKILEDTKRPNNYDFIYNLKTMLYGLSEKEIKLNLSNVSHLDNFELKARASQILKKYDKKIKYTPYGSVTGRLSADEKSFPILNLHKQLRSLIEPTNDFLLEIDFNSFELRIVLALNDKPQPEIDIHEWNKNNLFSGDVERAEAKLKFISWLYGNETSSNSMTPEQVEKAEDLYNRNNIKKKYFDGKSITNSFGRNVLCDNFHAFPYIIQSTGSDIFLRQAIKVDKLLIGKKSFIKFLIHDSLVIDVAKEDKKMIPEIFNQFSVTDFGKFPISKKVGKNFGSMISL